MATNKFLDADGVKILWDKCKRTFLSQENAAGEYLGISDTAVKAATSDNCTGNAATADKFKTARQINISDGENSGTAANFDGGENVTLNLPKTIKANLTGNATTATTLDTARSIQTNLESTAAANFDGSADIKIGVTGTLPVANGGTGQTNLDNVTVGLAKRATVLETARQIQTDLSSKNAANFNGSVNINPGVTGILEIENGGTGNAVGNATTATKLLNLRNISVQDYLAVNTGRSSSFDGSANINLKLPETIQANLTGNADTATKAEQDADGNIITSTYAPINNPTFTGTPQAPTATPNDDSKQLATTAFVAESIRRLVGAAPETLNTLVELSVAINKDANFATTVANEIAKKQDKHDALTSISKLLTGADKMIYTTASNVYAVTALTEFARQLLDDVNAATARNTLDALGKTENAVSATTARECTGNSATASKLQTARNFRVQDFSMSNTGEISNFDGTENISLKLPETIKANLIGNADSATILETARQFNISDGENFGTAIDFNGAENVTIPLPKTINAEIHGNAATADKLKTAREIKLSDGENFGAATNFDGGDNITLNLPETIKANLIGNADSATVLKNVRQLNISDGENSGAAVNFNGAENITLPLPKIIKADLDGNATTATSANLADAAKILQSSRSIQTNLESTIAENFDGSSDIQIGVAGILPVANGGTGQANLDNVTVGAATKATFDNAGNIIIETYSPKLNKIPLKIPVDGWIADSDTHYGYHLDLSIESVNAGDVLNINLAPENHGVSVACGLCATVEIFNNQIRLKAKAVPTAEIAAEYYILKGVDNGKNSSFGAINTSTSQREIIYVTPEQDGQLSYNGKIQRPVWLYFDWTKLAISGETSGIDAGAYAVTFTPIGNCTWADDTRTPHRVIWKIDKVVVQFPEQIGEIIFDGETRSPTLKNFDAAQMTLTGDFENQIDAGTYTAYATPTENFMFADNSSAAKPFTWEIQPLKIDKPVLTDIEKIYSGIAQSPNLGNGLSTRIEQTGTISEINAGDYNAIFELKDAANTRWADGSIDAVILPWKILKAENVILLDKNSLSLGNANSSVAVTVTYFGDGEISATSSDTDIATAFVSDKKIFVTARATGGTKIQINISEGKNYLAASATLTVDTFIIKPLNQCTPAEILDAVKSGKAGDAWVAGDKTLPIILNGQIGAALTLNNFEICARILGIDHNKNLESGGNPSIHFALDATVDGKDIVLCDANYDSASASGVKYFQHNLRFGTNSGGWIDSNLRDILNDIFNALPQDWKEIISVCTKYTDNTGNGDYTSTLLPLTINFSFQLSLKFSGGKIMLIPLNKIFKHSTIFSKMATTKSDSLTMTLRRFVIGGSELRSLPTIPVFVASMSAASKILTTRFIRSAFCLALLFFKELKLCTKLFPLPVKFCLRLTRRIT